GGGRAGAGRRGGLPRGRAPPGSECVACAALSTRFRGGSAGRAVGHAPYLPSRPAWASASGSRYIAGNCPSPPRRQYDSPNSVTGSVRHVFAHNNVGTGCQLWRRSLLGVLWSPVTISTSGFSARTFGSSASTCSIISTLAAKLPSSPVLSVYL